MTFLSSPPMLYYLNHSSLSAGGGGVFRAYNPNKRRPRPARNNLPAMWSSLPPLAAPVAVALASADDADEEALPLAASEPTFVTSVPPTPVELLHWSAASVEALEEKVMSAH